MNNETEKQPQPYQERYRKLAEAMNFMVTELGKIEEGQAVSIESGWDLLKEFGARVWDTYYSCPEVMQNEAAAESAYARDIRDFQRYRVFRIEESGKPGPIKRLGRDGEKPRPEPEAPRSHLKSAG